MIINIILPYPARKPGGGHKILYQYANCLAKRGHRVNLIHPIKLKYMAYKHPWVVRWGMHHLLNSQQPNWFQFERGVESILVNSIDEQTVPDGDILVASYWATAYAVDSLSEKKGEKYYFIQNYEIWDGHKELVHQSYHLPLKKLVIANWLKEKLESFSADVTAHIPNAIDQKEFYLERPIDKRDPKSIIMLYSEVSIKGSAAALKVLQRLKEQIPELQCTLFGVTSAPANLPDWFQYISQPSRKELREAYNNAAIYLCSSSLEGWPLPPAESMTCGCALVGYDIGGLRDYAFHERSALLSPLGDEEDLLNNLKRLLENSDDRINLADKGLETILHFSWESSTNQMETIFQSKLLNES